jgi:hypothetical protein
MPHYAILYNMLNEKRLVFEKALNILANHTGANFLSWLEGNYPFLYGLLELLEDDIEIKGHDAYSLEDFRKATLEWFNAMKSCYKIYEKFIKTE